MKHALPISAILALLFCGAVVAAGKPFRLAQSQTNFACINNCNSASTLCINQCPAAGATSQIAPDINSAQVLPNTGRIDVLQNVSPIQCRLNCTSIQQFCYSTCR